MKSVSLFLNIKTAVFLVATCWVFMPVTAQITVTGNLNRGGGQNGILSGFAVQASGTETQIAYTDNQGNYSFTLQQGGSYDIRPIDCYSNPLNGVSTYDLVLVSQYILGIHSFSNPYQMIAADVNNNGMIGLDDSLELRKLILGIYLDLPYGNWRFVPEDYVFPNPSNPFSPPYPQSFHIDNLQAPVQVNFIGIKVGDVNPIADGSSEECGGISLPASIKGSVFRDLDDDCQFDAGEQKMAGWKVEATGNNVIGHFYGITDIFGRYDIHVFPGDYDVKLIPPNQLWQACDSIVEGVQSSVDITPSVDFSVSPSQDCPSMEVNLSTSGLRRCFTNFYQVQYCNQGTVTAENAHIEVDLDPYFDIIGSTIPYTNLGGDTYSFDLGDVPSGSCGTFRIDFILNCSAQLGQTHCIEARAYPDTDCIPTTPWTGPDLRVQGNCSGNYVNFVVTNEGGDMLQSTNYIVVEDIVVMTPPSPQTITLAAGASELISVPATGATVRLEVHQAPGHPWSNTASATVEGCGTNAQGGFSTGMVNLFPLDDNEPTTDIDCQENVGSFDPNDKQGFPLGVHEEHFVPMDQTIEYLIRFQNTGTDTAFNIVVLDTLNLNLDPGSIRLSGSSHPCNFSLSGWGIARFAFSNIMLPDSNVNEPASHGFVKFLIAPKPGLPEGSIAKNRAGIYFDFNDPVMTNTTTHTFGTQYLGASQVFVPGIGLDVFPNPATDAVVFELKTPQPQTGYLEIYQIDGKLAARQRFEHNRFTFHAGQLKPGCYWYQLVSARQALAAGKLIRID